MQNTTTLPINDSPAFLAIMKLLTASNPAAGLWSLSVQGQVESAQDPHVGASCRRTRRSSLISNCAIGATCHFVTGRVDVVKYSATPSPDNPARPLQRSNPNGLQDELIRHVQEDSKMSSFDFGVQFLDADRMTYWGKRHDANFWIENASVEWNEAEAPFHTVARLTLLSEVAACLRMPPKQSISMSQGTRHLTARPSEASIAPAGLRK